MFQGTRVAFDVPRTVRKLLGSMTFEEIASEMHVSTRTVRRWLSGENAPATEDSAAALRKLAESKAALVLLR